MRDELSYPAKNDQFNTQTEQKTTSECLCTHHVVTAVILIDFLVSSIPGQFNNNNDNNNNRLNSSL